jgi:hypothetical protein
MNMNREECKTYHAFDNIYYPSLFNIYLLPAVRH